MWIAAPSATAAPSDLIRQIGQIRGLRWQLYQKRRVKSWRAAFGLSCGPHRVVSVSQSPPLKPPTPQNQSGIGMNRLRQQPPPSVRFSPAFFNLLNDICIPFSPRFLYTHPPKWCAAGPKASIFNFISMEGITYCLSGFFHYLFSQFAFAGFGFCFLARHFPVHALLAFEF